MLSADALVDEALLLSILESGHSRVPVHKPGSRWTCSCQLCRCHVLMQHSLVRLKGRNACSTLNIFFLFLRDFWNCLPESGGKCYVISPLRITAIIMQNPKTQGNSLENRKNTFDAAQGSLPLSLTRELHYGSSSSVELPCSAH